MSKPKDKSNHREAVFQRNLSSLRILAGFSVTELATILNISPQTLYNLENMTSTISTVQYIAIRAVLESSGSDDSNKVLREVLTALLDSENTPHNDNEEIQKALTTIAAAAATGLATPSLIGIASVLIPSFSIIPLGSLAGGVAISKWLKDLVKKKSR